MTVVKITIILHMNYDEGIMAMISKTGSDDNNNDDNDDDCDDCDDD